MMEDMGRVGADMGMRVEHAGGPIGYSRKTETN